MFRQATDPTPRMRMNPRTLDFAFGIFLEDCLPLLRLQGGNFYNDLSVDFTANPVWLRFPHHDVFTQNFVAQVRDQMWGQWSDMTTEEQQPFVERAIQRFPLRPTLHDRVADVISRLRSGAGPAHLMPAYLPRADAVPLHLPRAPPAGAPPTPTPALPRANAVLPLHMPPLPPLPAFPLTFPPSSH